MPVSNNPIQDVPVMPVVENVDSIQGQVIQTPKLTQDSQSADSVLGLSAAEMNDPNSIRVTISDPKAPLVILFGPPACGKTMTLVRMTRFLKSEGYTVSPIRTFRPTSDTN